MEGAAVDPLYIIVSAVLGMLGLTVGPIVVALINRGGKAKAIDLPPDKVVPRSEWDALQDEIAELDEKLHDTVKQAERRERQLTDERDAFYARAIRAETTLARHGLKPDGAP